MGEGCPQAAWPRGHHPRSLSLAAAQARCPQGSGMRPRPRLPAMLPPGPGRQGGEGGDLQAPHRLPRHRGALQVWLVDQHGAHCQGTGLRRGACFLSIAGRPWRDGSVPGVMARAALGCACNPLPHPVSSPQALGDQQQAEYMRGRRILEINPDSPIIQSLKDKVRGECRRDEAPGAHRGCEHGRDCFELWDGMSAG